MERYSHTYNNITASEIYEILKQEILDITLVPGALLSEKNVSTRFNVSRTPVRSAFDWLRKDNLVEVFPQKGTFVTLLDMDMIIQMIYMRSMVETGVMQEVAKLQPPQVLQKLQDILDHQALLIHSQATPREFFQSDNEFHEVCMNATYRQKLWQIILHLQTHYSRFRMLDYTDSQRFPELYEHHCRLFQCIKEQKTDLLPRLIFQHLFSGLLNSGDRLTTKYCDYFQQGEVSNNVLLERLRQEQERGLL